MSNKVELLNIAQSIQGQNKVYGNTAALVGDILVRIINAMFVEGNLTQSSGNDPQKVMSQKAVTQIMTAIDNAVYELSTMLVSKKATDATPQEVSLKSRGNATIGKLGVDDQGKGFIEFSDMGMHPDVRCTIGTKEDLISAMSKVSKTLLTFTTDAQTTRLLVPTADRRQGAMVTYLNSAGDLVVENYIGNTFTDAAWKLDANWVALAAKKTVDDLKKLIYASGGETQLMSVSADGNTSVQFIVGLDGCAYMSVSSKTPPSLGIYKLATENYVNNIFMATLKTINASDFVLVDGKWVSPAVQLLIGSAQVQITNNAETVLTVARGNSSASAFADVPGWQETVKVPGDVFNISGGTGGMFIKLKFTVKPTVVTILS